MDHLKDIETFVEVVRRQSYSRAAKTLGVTRALVSRRVSTLEAHLGVRLLNRNTRSLGLTRPGQRYYQKISALVEEMSCFERDLQEENESIRGTIKILTSKTFGEEVLPDIICKFVRKYPDIFLQITLRNMAVDQRDLISEGYDLALRTTPVCDSALLVRKIIDLPRLLMASPRYISEHGQPAEPSELVHHNCLDPSGDARTRWVFHLNGGSVNVDVSGNPSANSSKVLKQAAINGVGITLLPRYIANAELESGALLPLLSEYNVEPLAVYLLSQKNGYISKRVRLFSEFLGKTLR